MTKNDLKNKLTSPEEAVKLVHDHDRVFIGLVSNITPVLSDALWERRHELNDITIISGLLLRPTRLTPNLQKISHLKCSPFFSALSKERP